MVGFVFIRDFILQLGEISMIYPILTVVEVLSSGALGYQNRDGRRYVPYVIIILNKVRVSKVRG